MEKTRFSKVRPYVVVLLGVALIVTLFVVGYPRAPKDLYPSEIRDYEGQDLSSIGEFRENSISGPQHVNITNYQLAVSGLVDNTLQLSYRDVVNGHQQYQKVVTLYCVEGWDVTILWEGILVEDLLLQAGVKPEAKVVIFHAYDGYTTSLPIEYIQGNDILLAYKMNGLTLPPERGYPFELVAESQYGYKWIKWVTQIELSDDVDYRGYWERRGFPNNATLP
ncbi:MAG: molybdopterin-dependent oxidoreductase [Candidatus Bathyarchaeota archaeon]|nr:molybdopterin-dependent oxidoreductase [Candidatus Bathyarchaeota archaeon]